MDAREMECKKRLFKNSYCSRYKKSKKILSMKITDEHVHDKKMLPRLVGDIAKSKKSITLFGKILEDGAYDSNDVFECLADNGILPCIKVRSRNARVNKEANNTIRNISVISQKKKRFAKIEE